MRRTPTILTNPMNPIDPTNPMEIYKLEPLLYIDRELTSRIVGDHLHLHQIE